MIAKTNDRFVVAVITVATVVPVIAFMSVIATIIVAIVIALFAGRGPGWGLGLFLRLGFGLCRGAVISSFFFVRACGTCWFVVAAAGLAAFLVAALLAAKVELKGLDAVKLGQRDILVDRLVDRRDQFAVFGNSQSKGLAIAAGTAVRPVRCT